MRFVTEFAKQSFLGPKVIILVCGTYFAHEEYQNHLVAQAAITQTLDDEGKHYQLAAESPEVYVLEERVDAGDSVGPTVNLYGFFTDDSFAALTYDIVQDTNEQPTYTNPRPMGIVKPSVEFERVRGMACLIARQMSEVRPGWFYAPVEPIAYQGEDFQKKFCPL